jgi:hypothetical protein
MICGICGAIIVLVMRMGFEVLLSAVYSPLGQVKPAGIGSGALSRRTARIRGTHCAKKANLFFCFMPWSTSPMARRVECRVSGGAEQRHAEVDSVKWSSVAEVAVGFDGKNKCAGVLR